LRIGLCLDLVVFSTPHLKIDLVPSVQDQLTPTVLPGTLLVIAAFGPSTDC
jgi:hypothetical protein